MTLAPTARPALFAKAREDRVAFPAELGEVDDGGDDAPVRLVAVVVDVGEREADVLRVPGKG